MKKKILKTSGIKKSEIESGGFKNNPDLDIFYL